MPTTEHTINDAIADALRPTRRAWSVARVIQSENTGKLTGNAKRPDISVVEAGVSPVVIETEVLPAVTVAPEALERLGSTLRANGQAILSAVAVRSPTKLRTLDGAALAQAVGTADDFEFAMYTGESAASATRWPTVGWLKGSIADLFILMQAAAVPPAVIDRAADRLMTGVQQAAGQLTGIETKNPGALTRIATALCQEDGVQTRRMATTILANAFMFHETSRMAPVVWQPSARSVNCAARGS